MKVLVPPAVLADVAVSASLAAAESASAAATPAPSPKVDHIVDCSPVVKEKKKENEALNALEPVEPAGSEPLVATGGPDCDQPVSVSGGEVRVGAEPGDAGVGAVAGAVAGAGAGAGAGTGTGAASCTLPEIPRWCFAHHDMYVRYSRKRTLALRRSEPRRQPKAERSSLPAFATSKEDLSSNIIPAAMRS